jgi:carnitine monooxygenase subunit
MAPFYPLPPLRCEFLPGPPQQVLKSNGLTVAGAGDRVPSRDGSRIRSFPAFTLTAAGGAAPMATQKAFHISPEWFWSEERAAQEWTHLWTKAWHMGPRLEELPEPGDIMLHTLGRERLMFVKGDDGVIRGFYNVCRHRASRLMIADDGPASSRGFQCAFHGWRYGLDGKLVNVPYRERFDCEIFDDAKLTSLVSFRVEAFSGWVWYTLSDETPGLTEYLGPIGPKLAAYHMERAHIVDYKTFEFKCNWKTTFDAFNESYHFQALHSDILTWGNEDAPITLLNIHSMMVNEYGRPSRLYPEQKALNPALEALLQANGIDPKTFKGTAQDVRAAVQKAKRVKQGKCVFPYETLTDGQLTDAYHMMLFPTVHFNLFPEFYVSLRYRPHPSGDPEMMYFDFIMCAPLEPGEQPVPYEHRVVKAGSEAVGDVLQWGVRAHPIVNQVLSEDVEFVELVQQGLRSQATGRPLLGSDERRIAHFHESIDLLISGRSIRELMALRKTEPDTHSGL